MTETFFEAGWHIFPEDPDVIDWVEAARPAAIAALRDPDLDHWYQCERTWFVGLDALANDTTGRVGHGPPLRGQAVEFVRAACGGWPALHRAQISGVFPGYPRPRAGESETAFSYRLNRDAAHVDGVLGIGTPKRRFVQEPHAFILGLPLTQADADAAPLVVWQGSHRVMQAAFAQAFAAASGDLSKVDVTDAYTRARRRVFETCTRRTLAAAPGQAVLLHPFCLHGVAPWEEGAEADPDGRLIAYFRPHMPGGVAAWMAAR